MKEQDLISIIIPTYNRAHLIGETLDSVLAQTHSNWECIVVDDGSVDNTQDLLKMYCENDKRFQFHYRPNHKQKGANACRNLGLFYAKGKYVVFFDSDDLMTENHLEVKLLGINNNNIDFVITRTKYFNFESKDIDTYYNFESSKITSTNYIKQKINWLTLDVCIKTNIAKQISFNEKLQSGQEYNYYCKLVKITTNALFINEVVSLRRHHKESTRQTLNTKSKFNCSRFFSFWHTYLDIKNQLNFEEKLFLLQRCIDIIYKEKHMITNLKMQFFHEVLVVFKIKSIYFFMMIVSLKTLRKGFYFRQKLVSV